MRRGRLTRPKHWLDFAPFLMAHTPLKMSIPEVQAEVEYAWKDSYSPATTRKAIDWLGTEPVPYRISHLAARVFFRGIYFPHKNAWGWLKLFLQNRGTILHVIREAFTNWRGPAKKKEETLDLEPGVSQPAE